MSAPLLIMGAPGSPYTRKMLALLRYRRLPHEFIVRGSARHRALPKPRVELLPTFYLPDAGGTLEAHTDSTPLLRRFEGEFAGRAARPKDPAIAFLDSLLEDYADEWLTKPMFHYRWHYAADADKASRILPRWRNLTGPEEASRADTAAFAARQIGRLRYVGSSPATASVIEDSYVRFLEALTAHFEVLPFLMGGRPGASDFGIFGQLTQLAHFDPTPQALTLERAPRVYAWVGVVDDLSGLEPREDEWITRDAIPPTLLGLLREVGRTYVPVMLANARAVRDNAPAVEATVQGKPWTQNPFPYQAKCLKWLREEFAALADADRRLVDGVLEATGCAPLIHATP